MKTALLVIDVQQALIDDQPARKDEFMLNLTLLITAAHKNDTEVIYVRHDGGVEDTLAFGSAGWQLERSLTPLENERLFDKRFSSAFRQTGLREYLDAQEITQLVICGMQTEHCIDTSVKVAFEYGFDVIIPSGGTTTYSNPFLSGDKLINYYERMIWHKPLAQVVDMETALSFLQHQ